LLLSLPEHFHGTPDNQPEPPKEGELSLPPVCVTGQTETVVEVILIVHRFVALATE
jgi:hypothetical protein